MMLVWHYTIADRWASILQDGLIRPALPLEKLTTEQLEQIERIIATGEGEDFALSEAPAVWFSKRSTWEPTATKGKMDNGVRRNATLAEMMRKGPLVRIGVERDGLYTWLEHRKLSGIRPETAKGLVRAAAKAGASPGDWFVHYGPVPRDRWVRIERSTDGKAWMEETGVLSATPSL